MPDLNAEREELAQLIRKVMTDYRMMGEEARARVLAGRIQSAGFRKEVVGAVD